ncbi:MAG: tetratricopeptide repeat protein [Oligosphaeraceae bacterium]|nr:tetratricopeptide repeat protein [Oligosphaeraceae bacterium]
MSSAHRQNFKHMRAAMRPLLLFGLLSLYCIFLAPPLGAQNQVEEFKDPEQLFQYALGLMQRKFYDLALPQLQAFLQRYPDHAQRKLVLRMLIECSYALQKYNDTLESIGHFRQAWPKGPDSEALLQMEAAIRYSQGDYSGAAHAYGELSRSKDVADAELGLYFQAQSYLQLQQEEKAWELLAKLAQLPLQEQFPYRAEAAFIMAGRYYNQEKLPEALALYERLVAQKGLSAALREQSLLHLADLKFVQRDYAGALQGCEAYLLEYPEGEAEARMRKQRFFCAHALPDPEKTVVYGYDWRKRYPEQFDYALEYGLAESLSKLQRYEEALQILTPLGQNRTVPEQYRIAALLAELDCFIMLQRQPQVLQKGIALLQEFPKRPEKGSILFQVGKAAMKIEDMETAERYLRGAMEFFLGDNELFLLAAEHFVQCLMVRENWGEAALVSRRMAEKSDSPLRERCLLQALHFDYRMENWQRFTAEAEVLRRDFAAQPELLAEVLQLYANASLQQDDYAKANELLEQLYGLSDASLKPDVGFLRAQVLRYLNRNEEAVILLKQTLELPVLEAETKLKLQGLLLTLQLQQGDEIAALQLAEPVLLSLQKDSQLKLAPTLLFELAKLFSKHRQYEPAEKALELALAETQEMELRNRLNLLWAENLMLQHKEELALQKLEQLQTELLHNEMTRGQELYSLLAELHMSLQHHDLAFASAEKCLAMPEESPRFMVRAHWVTAKLLFEVENDAKNALPHCVKAFILYDDARYTPRAMQLCMEIYMSQGKHDEAQVTWKELQQRFPSWAASMQNSETVEKLHRNKE